MPMDSANDTEARGGLSGADAWPDSADEPVGGVCIGPIVHRPGKEHIE